MEEAPTEVADKEGEGGEEGEEGEGEEEEEEEHKEEAPAMPQMDNKLYKVMGCMRNIRKRKDRTDAMFEPLTATVDMLRTHMHNTSEVIPEKSMAMIEDGPGRWRVLKKKMEAKKEEVALAQQVEGAKIRQRADAFAVKVDEFRKFFQQKAPFSLPGGKIELADISDAYKMLDAFHHEKVEGWESVTTLVRDAEYLKECQDLFDLYVMDYVHLTRCAEELEHLKALWDMVAYVFFIFRDWRATKWEVIDTEMLAEKTKALGKEIKTLNKAARTYDVYKSLDDMVKAMAVALPLVSDLHDPAMRDRHWKQLMKATGKNFVMDENFTLGTLLDLELHKFQEEVGDIVDRAKKEEGIEKQLKKIEEVWSKMDLDFEPYSEVAEVFQVHVSDELREVLEQDNMALQNMAGGKYVQGYPKFVEIVNNWQKKLGTVEAVLQVRSRRSSVPSRLCSR